MKDVKDCMEMLNKRLVGTKVCDLVEKLENLKPIFKDYVVNYDYLFATLIKTFYEIAKERSTFYGKENMLTQPEFKDDVDELKKIFDLFSNPDRLNDLISKNEGKMIIDASEITDDLDNLTIITKDIDIEGDSLGKIAIIGPKRMDYNVVLSMLEYTINELTKHLIVDKKKGGND